MYSLFKNIAKNGKTTDHHVYLANILAPKVATKDREDEPFAWYAKDWLRSRLIGEKVEFHVEFLINERPCGTLYFSGKNMNVEIARTGLVRVNEKRKDTDLVSKSYPYILDALGDAKKKKIGIYKDSNEYHQKHKRDLTFSTDPDFDPEDYLIIAEEVDKPFKSYVEYVFSPNAVNVYIETLKIVTRVNMNHIYTPSHEKKISEEAKTMIERRLLNRLVGVKLQRIDEHYNLVGRIHHKNGDIDIELVKKGLAKVLTPLRDEEFDAEHFQDLYDAEEQARLDKVGLWNEDGDDPKKKTQTYEKNAKEYTAKVVEIHSGDSMTVSLQDSSTRRLFLASIKAPTMARYEDGEHEPWAWEAKEYLRKSSIGKNVHIEMEFKREIVLKGEESKGETRLMEFASVFVGKTNLAVEIVRKGFAKTALSKFKEDNSKYFEQLQSASSEAEEKKIGIYSIKDANIYRYIDTSKNLKAARTVFGNLSSKGDMQGVIEYVFSGSKFKIRLDTDNVVISFGLIGVEIPAHDPNQKEISAIYNRAKDNAKLKLHQHNVIINIKYMDKRGSFLGNLWHYDIDRKKRGRNYIIELVRNGQAYIVEDKNSNKLGKFYS